MLLNGIIELALHISMGSQRLLDVTNSTKLGPQLHRLKILHILGVEEHKSDNRPTFMDLKGMS
jgi:hypothetical protein